VQRDGDIYLQSTGGKAQHKLNILGGAAFAVNNLLLDGRDVSEYSLVKILLFHAWTSLFSTFFTSV
jgi:hypothetical protein